MDLSAQCILEVWEHGVTLPAEARTRALLGLVAPELEVEAITELTIGEQNNNLLELRQRLFGGKLQAYVECGACGEALDLEFAIDDFGFSAMTDTPDFHSIVKGKLRALVRLPNGHDLTALATVKNVEDGRRVLFARCLLELFRDEVPIAPCELREDEMNQLEAAIEELDPRMEILFDLRCPQCSHAWQSPLDIGAFLWRELDSYALILLGNVHLLASTYGWSEEDILTMSHVRRQHYIERLLQ